VEKTFLIVWYAVGALGVLGEALAFKLGEIRKDEPARHAELEGLLKEPVRLSLYIIAGASMGPFAIMYLDGWKLVARWATKQVVGRR